MAKIDIAARTPGIFKTNRRKCGWGAALTTCNICGKIMLGHNRGICSRCMRSTHAAVKRAQAQTMRDIYTNGGTK